MNNNALSDVIPFPAILPQSVAAAGTANGQRIIYPAQYGPNLAFIVTINSSGVTVLTVRVEGSNDAGSTWTPLKQNDGVTDLAFPAAAAIDATLQAGTTVMLGSIVTARAKYKDFRLAVRTVTGATVNIAAVAIVSGVYSRPPKANTDQLLNLFLPLGST